MTAVLTRHNFRFSPRNTAAACVARDGEGNLHLEAWSFVEPLPRWWPLPLTRAVTLRTQLIPLDDGCVLLCRQTAPDVSDENRSNGYKSYRACHDLGCEGTPRGVPSENGAGFTEIVLIDQRGPTVQERLLKTVTPDDLVILRLIPPPAADYGRASRGILPRHLAVLITVNTRGCSTIWRVAAESPHLERLAEIPGALVGGTWLDSAGIHLGVGRKDGNGRIKTITVDLRNGSWSPFLSVSRASNDRLLACAPGSGLLLVSTDAPGEERLGWGRLGADEPVRFPEILHRPGHPLGYPLTFDPGGQRVLLQFNQGTCSSLAVYTPAENRLVSVEAPAGVISDAACWTNEVLRFPFSAPCQPDGLATLHMDAVRGWSIAGSAPAPAGKRWVDAHIEQIDGAAGPIEAIVYGGKGWRTRRHVLLALHGGPVDAWRFTFEPLFQRLAAADIAVVALNQRGSTGYGASHARAIHGAWGGPDLDDICCVARALNTQRERQGAQRLMLLGVSYGAFLALLAASCEPELWSRCVAIAPFLSASRLHQEASPGIRGLIEAWGGFPELHDAREHRDVLRMCHTIQAKLLIVHGECDERIPVSQSRALRQRLLTLGRREHVDFAYVEIPDSQHDLLLVGAHTKTLHERLVRFLAAGEH